MTLSLPMPSYFHLQPFHYDGTPRVNQYVLIIIVLWLMISGCTKQTMSPEKTAEMTTKTYQAIPPATILHAASDLFFLADDKAFERTQTPNHLMAIRTYGLDIGLSFVQAKDIWNVELNKLSQGTQVKIDVRSEETWLTGNTQVQRPTGPAPYQQFWSRLDYLLEQSTTWMTCRDLSNEYLEDRTWGDTWWLCDNLADRTPPELIPGTWEDSDGLGVRQEDQKDCSQKVANGIYGKVASERQQEVYLSLCLEEKGYQKVQKLTES